VNTDELRGLLAERATDAGAPPAGLTGEVHQTIGTMRRRRTGAVVLGLAAVVSGAVLAVNVVPGSSSRSSDPVDQPDPTPSRTVTKGDAPVMPGAGVVLDPGRWTLLPDGDDPGVRAVVDIPEGYESGEWFVGSATAPFRAIGLWNIARVFENGCTHEGGAVRVDTAAEVAAALEAQQLTTTTRPVPLTLDGYDGLTMTLTAPSDRPGFSSCKVDRLDIFDTAGGDGSRFMETPGGVDHYWILDIDGNAYLFNAYAAPGTTDAQVEELAAIVESTRFSVPDEG